MIHIEDKVGVYIRHPFILLKIGLGYKYNSTDRIALRRKYNTLRIKVVLSRGGRIMGIAKRDFLTLWRGLKQTKIRARPIPYKHVGSTYDCDGIRITGSEQFIVAVLSNLKDLLEQENSMTRLQVTYQDAKDKSGNLTGTKSCYIQVCERGPEAKMASAIFNKYR